jgi:hypothetical protein
MNKEEKIKLLRVLFHDIGGDIKALVNQRKHHSVMSHRWQKLSAPISGLTQAQGNINRMVRKLNKGEEI